MLEPAEQQTGAPEFDRQAGAYAAFRPTYPEQLLVWLLDLTAGCTLAWDVGTGNGQVAVMLAPHFKRVQATDSSEGQLAHAMLRPNITYNQYPAEKSGIASQSADLITVAQAAHWFDLEKFYAEVRRVLKPSGVLALWGYDIPRADIEALDTVLEYFDKTFLGPYWSVGREHINEHYATLDFPFEMIQAPPILMSTQMNLDGLVGYLSSWSALQTYRKQHHSDPLPEMRRQLSEVWPADRQVLPIRFPTFCKVTRIS